jgi:solute carrier family 25 (adenine nucleotide translocator) protein 4/5/6/31
VQTIHAQEGLQGFYKGLGPNIIRGIGGALLLVLYDEFNTLLK